MQNKKVITFFILSALAVAVTFGAIAYQSVYATSPTPETSITGTTTSSSSNRAIGRGPYAGYTSQQLADALGITTDALTTAYQNAYSAVLKDAVTQGLITQAQADELTTNGTAFPFGNRWEGWLTLKGIDFNTYLADALGITVDTLKAAYQTAYNANIDQMVTDGNITQTQANQMKSEYALYNDSTFQSSMQAAFTSAVNVSVTSGVITQAQADQILSNNSNMFKQSMGGWDGGPKGDGGGRGGFIPDNDQSPPTTP